jgi:hypothetical protein
MDKEKTVAINRENIHHLIGQVLQASEDDSRHVTDQVFKWQEKRILDLEAKVDELQGWKNEHENLINALRCLAEDEARTVVGNMVQYNE